MSELSRRDQFAMAIITGFAFKGENDPEFAAQCAIKIADALIAELDKAKPQKKCEHDWRRTIHKAGYPVSVCSKCEAILEKRTGAPDWD